MRKLLVFLLVVVALLVVADRVAAVVASHAIADDIAQDQSQCAKPGVDIGGFPFLTQAVAGRYSHVTLTTTCDEVSRPKFLDPLTVTLTGVRVPLHDALHGSVQSVPVDHATATALIPFAALNRSAGPGELTFSRGPAGTIMATGTVTVDGHSVSAHGAAQVSIADGALRLTVSTGSSSVATALGGLSSTFVLPLPYHLRSVSASASDSGVLITATASHLVLSR